ncbi:hypothetical protein BGZ49_005414, partial [Haplosporangium sp. Z 27]
MIHRKTRSASPKAELPYPSVRPTRHSLSYTDPLPAATHDITASLLQQHLKFLLPSLEDAMTAWASATTEGELHHWGETTARLQQRIDHVCNQLADIVPRPERRPDPDLAAYARLLEASWQRHNIPPESPSRPLNPFFLSSLRPPTPSPRRPKQDEVSSVNNSPDIVIHDT